METILAVKISLNKVYFSAFGKINIRNIAPRTDEVYTILLNIPNVLPSSPLGLNLLT